MSRLRHYKSEHNEEVLSASGDSPKNTPTLKSIRKKVKFRSHKKAKKGKKKKLRTLRSPRSVKLNEQVS
jgi:hypothetical protein